MKKLIVILLLLASPIMAEESVTIAIRTNQFDSPSMYQLFTHLGQHVAPKYLSDSFHGLKNGCKGGQWIAYTNSIGHVWMVNNFRKSELEATTRTRQYDGQGNVTNTITHGRKVDNARISEVKGGHHDSAFKIGVNNNPKATLSAWGLSPVIVEGGLP